MRTRALAAFALVLGLLGLLGLPLPAEAAPRVGISNEFGAATIDTTYATTLNLSGSGFQSIQNGYGGIYVFFGTVRGTWQPSQGGQTGTNYLYVPDSESRDNQGFQKFVTYPGSDTAGTANGGTIDSAGNWSTQLTVPGAVFNAVDRNGRTVEVDCRRETCGIITVGAHGVVNGSNESFTPVSVDDIYAGPPPASSSSGGTTAQGGQQTAGQAAGAGTDDEDEADDEAGEATLTVDRTAAIAGRVMSFNATGLTPGDLVVATLGEGLAAAGPIAVGLNGQVAGAIELPADLEPGTHVLRLTGSQELTVSFAVRTLATDGDTPWIAISAAAAAGTVFLLALVFSALRIRAARRKASA